MQLPGRQGSSSGSAVLDKPEVLKSPQVVPP